MKFRLTLGLSALFAAVLVFGIGAQPTQAHAATPVTLSPADQSNLQAVLDITKIVLDTVQVQIARDEVQNPAAVAATLSGVRSYLVNMNVLLSGTPVASAPQQAGPVASAPRGPVAPTAQGPVGSQVASEEPQVVQPIDQPPAVVEEEPQDQQTASVSSSVASRWVFWLILIAAVVLAVILAVPRRKVSTMSEAPEPPRPQPQQPQQQSNQPPQQQQ